MQVAGPALGGWTLIGLMTSVYLDGMAQGPRAGCRLVDWTGSGLFEGRVGGWSGLGRWLDLGIAD